MDTPHFLSRLPVRFLEGKVSRPPRALIETYLNTEGLNGHWWWDGDLNDEGEAVLRWGGSLERKRGSVFPVLWFIYADTLGGIVVGGPRASNLINQCGHVRCVNPDHWHHQTFEERKDLREEKVVTYDEQGRPLVRTVKSILKAADAPRPTPKP